MKIQTYFESNECIFQKLVKDLFKLLEQVNSEEIPDGLKLPQSFNEFLSDMKNNQYDAKTFALKLKATV